MNLTTTANQIFIFASSAFIAFFISIRIQPYLTKLSISKGLLDFPNSRKKHKKPIVRIGGIIIFLSFIFSIIISSLIYKNSLIYIFQSKYSNVLFFSLLIFFIIGILDDLFDLTATSRLIVQLIVSYFIWANDISISVIDISWLNLDPSYIILPKYISMIFTLLWIVGLTNAINWIDGLDGLAAGVCSIFLIGLLFIGLRFWDNQLIIMTSGLLGGTLGFLKNNFYPAKIYLGDSGSYLLGIMVAILSLISFKPNYPVLEFHLNILFFLVPILDMIIVIISRLKAGISPFLADRSHFHYRLLSLGISHRRTVIILYLLNIFTSSYVFKLMQN